MTHDQFPVDKGWEADSLEAEKDPDCQAIADIRMLPVNEQLGAAWTAWTLAYDADPYSTDAGLLAHFYHGLEGRQRDDRDGFA